MRDPFEPPSKRGRKPMLFDFLVLGTVCHTCLRAVCIHKVSIFHTQHINLVMFNFFHESFLRRLH